jgi:hypothetical protein
MFETTNQYLIKNHGEVVLQASIRSRKKNRSKTGCLLQGVGLRLHNGDAVDGLQLLEERGLLRSR